MRFGSLLLGGTLVLGMATLGTAAEVNCKQVNKYLQTGRSVKDVAETMVISESVAAESPATEADRYWMRQALAAATRAGQRGEVPVGAVVVRGGQRLARAGNGSIAAHDPSGHAEIRALRAAARRVGN